VSARDRRRRRDKSDEMNASFRRDRSYTKTTIAGRDFYDVDIGRDAPMSERDSRVLLIGALGILVFAIVVAWLVTNVF
jgi:hypothetical protein